MAEQKTTVRFVLSGVGKRLKDAPEYKRFLLQGWKVTAVFLQLNPETYTRILDVTFSR